MKQKIFTLKMHAADLFGNCFELLNHERVTSECTLHKFIFSPLKWSIFYSLQQLARSQMDPKLIEDIQPFIALMTAMISSDSQCFSGEKMFELLTISIIPLLNNYTK